MVARPWAPRADPTALRARARLYADIRRFFAERDVLEVDTPVLSATASGDPNIEPLHLSLFGARRWLATSPEFPIKRLLAAGIGDCYQIAPVFRADEPGRWHEPEFRLLEWYRIGFDAGQLMQEIEELVSGLLQLSEPFDRISYAAAVQQAAGIDIHSADVSQLADALLRTGVDAPAGLSRAQSADLLMGTVVSPTLGATTPCFVTDYPAGQAALARIRPGNPPLAERFELFINGIEIANGFHELTDAAEQRQRFEADIALRAEQGRLETPIDEALLAALDHGLPECSGVALGLDRLLALMLGREQISEVIAFPADRA